MPLSGMLGTPDSRLGNIVLGYGGVLTPGTGTALQGVTAGQVGEVYDFAMGFDPGTGQVTLFGYVLKAGSAWNESTELQDVQRLITVASASTTDRDLTRWPKVSQGDWSKGERQLIFTDPARYFSSDGNLDVSEPGSLQPLPGAQSANYTLTGTYNTLPLVSDGPNWYLGLSQAGSNLLIGGVAGVTAYNVAGGAEILDMLMTPYGVFFATATGIFSVTSAGVASAVLTVQEGVSPQARQSLAYFGGQLFWISSDDMHIRSANAISGAGVANPIVSTNAFETHYSCLASTAAGIFYSKYHEITATSPVQQSVLYVGDGTTAGETRVADINGLVKQAYETNGTTYILVQEYQLPPRRDYTLYGLTSTLATGAQLSVIDDTRSVLFPEFWASNPSPTAYCRGSLWGDGRFLYLAWPGLIGKRLDLVTGGLSSLPSPGGAGQTSLAAHRMVNTTGVGLVSTVGAGSTATVRQHNRPSLSGTLVTSYIDFNTPRLVKAWRSVEIETFSPLPSGASLQIAFALEASSGFIPMTVQQTQPNTFTAYFPGRTVATRARFQLTLMANGSGSSPQVAVMAVRANLGRVWSGTASCKRRQLLRNNSEDAQNPTVLLANFEQAYQNAGRCVLLVPSPNNPPSYVEQVNAVLQNYSWESVIPGPRSDEQGSVELEGEVQFAFSEDSP